jgi:hypothetical protein
MSFASSAMAKLSFCAITCIALFIPALTFASCSPSGASIVYVNGIETTQQEADDDTTILSKKLLQYGGSPDIQIITGYNPTHLDGLGDELESVSQAFGAPISNYDLDTILNQIAPELTTRKLLLLGHSQGTFYTNEMYDYLVKNGVPPQSIALYNLATPASAVAGGGTYLTSGNDKLINQVRVWDAEAGTPEPLPANILIPLQPGDGTSIYGGHYFTEDYLAGAAARIISDISSALGRLVVSNTDSAFCFTPPSLGLAYDAQKAAFAIADPAATGVDAVSGKITGAVSAVASAVVSAGNALTQTVNAGIGDAFFSVFPKPDAQSAGAVFAVEKALYGSSLSEADYEALVQGKDLPEDEPPMPGPSQTQSSKEQPPQPQPVENQAPTVPAPPVPAKPSEEAIQPPQPRIPPTPQPLIPPTSQPLLGGISISPGFGGGEPAPAAAQVSAPETSQEDATSSPSAGQSQNDQSSDGSSPDQSQDQTTPPADQPADDASSTSATSTSPGTSDTGTVQEPPPSSCGHPSLTATGDFFSEEKDDAEYSPAGFLEYHFKNAKDGGFTLTWNYFDDQCDISGPIDPHPAFQLSLPPGIYDWSVRFTSMTHFDIWDDDDAVMLGSYDIPGLLPIYSSIAFDAGSIDGNGNHSSLVSRGLKIFESGEPPSFVNSVPTPAGCPDFAANGYLFDPSYENTEYVDGLLRVHLRLLAPYNEGRLFRAEVLTIGSDCSFPAPYFGFGFPQTVLTPFIRYYSFRMASSTHWILWDDENDVQIQCDVGCEGDIPDGTDFVSFYGIVDDFTSNSSSVRTTPYPPTGP